MSKHTKALEARLDEIDAELDKTTKQKKRDRLWTEYDEVMKELQKERAKAPVVEEVSPLAAKDESGFPTFKPGKAVAEAGKRHLAHLQRVGELEHERGIILTIIAEPSTKKKALKLHEARIAEIDAEIEGYREATRARTLEVAHETTARNLNQSDEEIKARVLAKRAAREAQELRPEGGQTEQEAGVIHAEDEHVVIEKVATHAAALENIVAELAAVTDVPTTLVDPEAVQPRDRWGRPIIVGLDGKERGYRRMTTFIDVIDDKDNLIKWKGRVILAGVAATEQKIAGDSDLVTIDEVGTESIVERVEAANQALEETVKRVKKAHKKGKLDETELQDALDGAEKAHRTALADLAEEAFQAGDGYLKAETGTRIHKLTEYVDRGEDLPDDATDTERRDIAAYVAARDALGVEVKLIEQFVVLDELEVGGTLDRLIRIDSPKLGRRVTAIGDVKTGRMDFGAGKMARQLAGYARGKTYDWRDPENSRKPLRANQEVGYIFNVPAGQGVCFVYELDLKLGAQGLKICKEIFDYRAETSTLKKVGTLIHSTEKEK